MPCKSCTEKWAEYYVSKGFTEKDARFMAHKLVLRVEKRQRKERNKLLYRKARFRLFKWTFIINVKATILHSFLNHRLIWVGKSYNPDYTQNCFGTCVSNTLCDNYLMPCTTTADCRLNLTDCPMGGCGCPAPLPNSAQVVNGCTCHPNPTACQVCNALLGCTVRLKGCGCLGTCGYNCNSGFIWNGSQCVASAVALDKAFIGGGFYHVFP